MLVAAELKKRAKFALSANKLRCRRGQHVEKVVHLVVVEHGDDGIAHGTHYREEEILCFAAGGRRRTAFLALAFPLQNNVSVWTAAGRPRVAHLRRVALAEGQALARVNAGVAREHGAELRRIQLVLLAV